MLTVISKHTHTRAGAHTQTHTHTNTHTHTLTHTHTRAYKSYADPRFRSLCLFLFSLSLSLSSSLCIYIYMVIYTYLYVYIYIYFYLSVSLPARLPFCRSVRLSSWFYQCICQVHWYLYPCFRAYVSACMKLLGACTRLCLCLLPAYWFGWLCLPVYLCCRCVCLFM